MPTIFTHAAIGYTVAKLAGPTDNRRVLIAAAALAALPDVDGLWFSIIPYRHPLGHRGLTHSLLFAAIAGAATALLFVFARGAEPRTFLHLTKLIGLFTLSTASHGFFDALTNGGAGVAFFAPFDHTRFFFPFRPIPVSPMSGAALLTSRGAHLLFWELWFFWTFAAAAAVWERTPKWRMVVALLFCLLGVVAWVAVIA